MPLERVPGRRISTSEAAYQATLAAAGPPENSDTIATSSWRLPNTAYTFHPENLHQEHGPAPSDYARRPGQASDELDVTAQIGAMTVPGIDDGHRRQPRRGRGARKNDAYWRDKSDMNEKVNLTRVTLRLPVLLY